MRLKLILLRELLLPEPLELGFLLLAVVLLLALLEFLLLYEYILLFYTTLFRLLL